MLNGRLYRLSWLVALVALLVALLTLETPGGAPDPPLPPAFDAIAARGLAASLNDVAPQRVPGTPGDTQAANWVADRFAEVPGATAVRRQVFAVSTPGGRVTTQNVYVSLPARTGSTSSRRAVIISAPRDTPPGVSGAESGSAVLVQLARALGTVARERPVFVVSTGASTLGNAGARWFTERFAKVNMEAALSLDDPAGNSAALYLWDDGQDGRRALALGASALQAAARAGATVADGPGPFSQIAMMGVPQTRGDQAAYITAGIPSVSLASRPETPLVGGKLASEAALGTAGRTAETMLGALDLVDRVARPSAGLIIGGRELQSTMSRVVIVLLALPLLVAALDLAVRMRRARVRGVAFLAALGWRLLPVVVGMLVAHLLATAGLMASASGGWPPLAGDVPLDLPAAVAMLMAIGAGVLTWLAVRHRATRRDAEVASRAAAGIIALGAVCVLLWLVNPFALVLALPPAHAALVATRARRRWQVVALGLIAIAPVVLLWAWMSGRIDRGIPQSAWYLLETALAGGRGLLVTVLAAAILVITWSMASLVFRRTGQGLMAAGPYKPVPSDDERHTRRGRRHETTGGPTR